jgi:hypothetical protein
MPSPSTSPSVAEGPPVVRTRFASNSRAFGERLTFWVDELGRDFGCRMHSYQDGAIRRKAFLSHCPFLESQDYQVILFSITLKNEIDRPLRFNLRNFVLTDRDGDTWGPVNIRSVEGVAVANYIPERGILPPRAKVDGWLTFDARTGGKPPVAGRLSYIDGGQTLTVQFQGKHTVAG